MLRREIESDIVISLCRLQQTVASPGLTTFDQRDRRVNGCRSRKFDPVGFAL